MNYAYYQGEPFSGEVFSSDEQSMMVIRNGIALLLMRIMGKVVTSVLKINWKFMMISIL